MTGPQYKIGSLFLKLRKMSFLVHLIVVLEGALRSKLSTNNVDFTPYISRALHAKIALYTELFLS